MSQSELAHDPPALDVLGSVDWDAERWVLALRGEHDAATAPALCEALRQRIDMDRGAVVLDLNEVTFMGVASVGVIVAARETLRRQGRGLLLSDPSPSATLVLELCGVPFRPGAEALATWLAVPVQNRNNTRRATDLGGL